MSVLLLGDGAVRVEADGVVGGAGDRNGLGVDTGVEPDEHVRVVLHGARMGGDAGGVLVAADAQPERVAGIDLCGGVRVHPHHVRGVSGVRLLYRSIFLTLVWLFTVLSYLHVCLFTAVVAAVKRSVGIKGG